MYVDIYIINNLVHKERINVKENVINEGKKR